MAHLNNNLIEILITRRFNPFIVFISALFMIVIIGIIDYQTGTEISVALLYLIPIGLVSWFINKNVGLAISLLSSIDWLLISIFDNHIYSHPAIPFWNALVELTFFTIISYTISSVKVLLIREREIARCDSLTGIANRRAFMEIIAQEFERSQRYNHAISIAYLDLDNFKTVNDKFGHEVGDKLLKTIVDIMKKHTRTSDIMARLGGDEFAVLLPETDPEAARTVLIKLQETVRKEMIKRSWPVTMSIGLISFQQLPISYTEAIHLADQLMYKVKNQGKDSILQDIISPENYLQKIAPSSAKQMIK